MDAGPNPPQPGSGAVPTVEQAEPETEAKQGFIAGQIADIKKWFAGLQIQQLWQYALVLVVLATAGFGGMDTVTPKSTTFAANQSHSTGELTLVVQRAAVKTELKNEQRVVFRPQDGRRYLAVLATVTNNGTVPERFGPFGRTMIPVGIPYQEAYPASVVRVSDSSPAVLQPGATSDLIFVWSVPDNAIKPGGQVTLRVPNRIFGDYRAGFGRGWVDGPTSADITLGVPA